MALLFEEKPELIDGSNAMEETEVPEIYTGLLMSLLEESQCDEYCNEEQINSLMESLEAEIRIASDCSCSTEGGIGSNDCFEWSEMEMVPSSPSDDMNWYVEDHVQEMSMDGYLEVKGSITLPFIIGNGEHIVIEMVDFSAVDHPSAYIARFGCPIMCMMRMIVATFCGMVDGTPPRTNVAARISPPHTLEHFQKTGGVVDGTPP
ncbi:hypothetical protein Gotur_028202 [Gossypium turneri]